MERSDQTLPFKRLTATCHWSVYKSHCNAECLFVGVMRGQSDAGCGELRTRKRAMYARDGVTE